MIPRSVWFQCAISLVIKGRRQQSLSISRLEGVARGWFCIIWDHWSEGGSFPLFRPWLLFEWMGGRTRGIGVHCEGLNECVSKLSSVARWRVRWDLGRFRGNWVWLLLRVLIMSLKWMGMDHSMRWFWCCRFHQFPSLCMRFVSKQGCFLAFGSKSWLVLEMSVLYCCNHIQSIEGAFMREEMEKRASVWMTSQCDQLTL